MLQLKACPKCGTGDMTIDRDMYGWFRQCIQCGYLDDLPKAPAQQVTTGATKKAVIREAA